MLKIMGGKDMKIWTLKICDLPWQNQAKCADRRFWVKATITNYNLWTATPANLKSLARVYTCSHGDTSQNVPYAHCLLRIHGPAHTVNELDGCQNAPTRTAPAVLMEKNQKTSVFKLRWHTKLKKKSGWWTFYLQLPRLPTATGLCHERSM